MAAFNWLKGLVLGLVRETCIDWSGQPFYQYTLSSLLFDFRCQDVFLQNVELDKNIARNQALKENLFMMVTCIELRIPLFLVGKPGSSKSLAKTIVADAMQGNSAHKELFKHIKAVKKQSKEQFCFHEINSRVFGIFPRSYLYSSCCLRRLSTEATMSSVTKISWQMVWSY